MDGLRFNDLLHHVPVSIGIGYGYLGFVSNIDDIEVSFTPTDCKSIVDLLEEVLSKAGSGKTGTHKFGNRGGDEGIERASFSIRELPTGIEMTLTSGLKDDENNAQTMASTMSICISKEDAKLLSDALAEQLVNLRNSSSPE